MPFSQAALSGWLLRRGKKGMGACCSSARGSALHTNPVFLILINEARCELGTAWQGSNLTTCHFRD